jgi:Acetyl xylan esterase (AXE1)
MQGRLPGTRTIVALAMVVAALVVPQAAAAAIGSVFGGDVSCSVQADGVRFCGSSSPRSTTKSFDGVPIDVNVAFPPEQPGSADSDYPLIMIFHGYGGDKLGLNVMQPFLDRGYATFSMTDRGFHESCGSAASRAADPAGCAKGYVRLIDNRYEVRDAQLFAGRLADESLVDPGRIGATGGSYGGGMSMALAALKDRTVLEDGSLVPWTSPGGKAMALAGAAANIPWTDLAYSLTPNGSTLDYVADAPYVGRVGVMKESLTNGLYLSGRAAPGFYAPEGSDPSADLTGWRDLLLAGEPYDNRAGQAVVDEITTYHSSYYIDDSTKPAPVLISNGFTDDLFPADEAVRFYNRTRTTYPNAEIAMFFGDFGHPRAQNKDDVGDLLQTRQTEWLDHYVLGSGPEPQQGVEAMTETCPESAPSGGPLTAKSWAGIARGEIRIARGAERTIAPDSTAGGTFDPVSGGGACATADGADIAGSATYRLDPAPEGGYTLIGSPTVIAEFTLPGDTSQVAARLLDVSPDGTEILVARGLWRPETGGPTKQVFQLHPNGWQFAEGHVPKLELLANDSGGQPLNSYGRPSNNQQPVTVSHLKLRLPVRERPGSLDSLVKAAAPRFLPDGYELAADFADLPDPGAKVKGKLRVTGSRITARVQCPRRFAACSDGSIELKAAAGSKAGKRARGRFKVATGQFEAGGGERVNVKMKLTPRARSYFRTHSKLKVKAKVKTAERKGAWKRNRKAVAR